MEQQRAGVQRLSMNKQELQTEKQEQSPSLVQEDPEPPHMKEEQEELWSSQEGEQLQELEEADTMFFNIITVKSEDDDPGRYLQPETVVKPEDASEAVMEDSDDWRETKEQPGLITLENISYQGQNKTGARSFSCSECDKTFKKKQNLTLHMRNHTGEKPFSCSACGKSFSRKEGLSRHMLVHTEEKPFSCPICTNRFKHKGTLTRHMLVHTRQSPSSCSNIYEPFSQRVGHQASELHQSQTKEKREAGPKPEGEGCKGADPARDLDPKRHPQPETEVKIEGNDDWMKTGHHHSCFEAVKNVKINQIHTAEKPHRCSVCGKTFKKKQNLTTHMRIHTGEKPFSCPLCCKCFKQKDNLTKHMLVHTGEKPFSCSECGKRFNRKWNLTSHMLVHTRPLHFSCDPCGNVFNHQSVLTLHMARHRGEKPFSCSVCGQRFSWPSKLKIHKCSRGQAAGHQCHSEEKNEGETGADGEDCAGAEPSCSLDTERHLILESEDGYDDCKATREHRTLKSMGDIKSERRRMDQRSHSCSECGKTFKQKPHLRIHQRIHTGEKPYICSECGRRFTQKGGLTKHLLVHRREKPFPCSQCGRNFRQKEHLNRHMLIHKEEKPFSCCFCSKRFNHKQNLTLHLARHRGEKPFSCSICNQGFFWRYQLKRHNCGQDRKKSERRKEAETGARRENCGGLKPAKSQEEERPSHPEIEVKVEDSDDNQEEHTEHQPGSKTAGRTHRRTQNAALKPHSCSKCGKAFKKRQSLNTHLRIHTGEKPFSCTVCGKRCSQKGNLKVHMAQHIGKKPFSCSFCSKTFTRKGRLSKHTLVHTRMKHPKDSVHDQRFKSSQTLLMLQHGDEKPFSCSLCGKRFSWSQQLQRHKCIEGQASELHQNQTENNEGAESPRNSDPERHVQPETEVKTEDSSGAETDDSDKWMETKEEEFGLNLGHLIKERGVMADEKSYCCSCCDKTFSQKHDLIRHMRIHSGEKPFGCSECGKAFNRKCNLKVHIAHHKGEKPYSCSACNLRFSRHYQLKKHKCDGGQASELRQGKREGEAGADGGAEPDKNLNPEKQIHPEIMIKTEGDSEEIEGGYDD